MPTSGNWIIVGLGNPGSEYENTRHNMGRATVMSALKRLDAKPLEPWAKAKALIREVKIGRTAAIFLLPDTFMNKSGAAVAPCMSSYKGRPEHLLVIHDDVDLPLGRAKLSFGRNSGGHKGVESVMRAIKSKDFWRMRLGVQKKRRVPGEDLVLQKFRGDEELTAKKVIKKSAEAISIIITEGADKAMNKYNA